MDIINFVDIRMSFNLFVIFFLQKFAMLSHYNKQWRYYEYNGRGGKESGNGDG